MSPKTSTSAKSKKKQKSKTKPKDPQEVLRTMIQQIMSSEMAEFYWNLAMEQMFPSVYYPVYEKHRNVTKMFFLPFQQEEENTDSGMKTNDTLISPKGVDELFTFSTPIETEIKSSSLSSSGVVVTTESRHDHGTEKGEEMYNKDEKKEKDNTFNNFEKIQYHYPCPEEMNFLHSCIDFFLRKVVSDTLTVMEHCRELKIRLPMVLYALDYFVKNDFFTLPMSDTNIKEDDPAMSSLQLWNMLTTNMRLCHYSHYDRLEEQEDENTSMDENYDYLEEEEEGNDTNNDDVNDDVLVYDDESDEDEDEYEYEGEDNDKALESDDDISEYEDLYKFCEDCGIRKNTDENLDKAKNEEGLRRVTTGKMTSPTTVSNKDKMPSMDTSINLDSDSFFDLYKVVPMIQEKDGIQWKDFYKLFLYCMENIYKVGLPFNRKDIVVFQELKKAFDAYIVANICGHVFLRNYIEQPKNQSIQDVVMTAQPESRPCSKQAEVDMTHLETMVNSNSKEIDQVIEMIKLKIFTPEEEAENKNRIKMLLDENRKLKESMSKKINLDTRSHVVVSKSLKKKVIDLTDDDVRKNKKHRH